LDPASAGFFFDYAFEIAAPEGAVRRASHARAASIKRLDVVVGVETDASEKALSSRAPLTQIVENG
jgi:hypothetical protein